MSTVLANGVAPPSLLQLPGASALRLQCWALGSQERSVGQALLSWSLLEGDSRSSREHLLPCLLAMGVRVYDFAPGQKARHLSEQVDWLALALASLRDAAALPCLLLGSGLGASAALLQAAREPNLAGLALCDVVSELPSYLASLPAVSAQIQQTYQEDGRTRDVLAAAAIVDCPVLIMQWEQASQVGLHEGQDVAVACRHSQLLWLDGDEQTMLRQQAEYIRQFVNSMLALAEH